MLSHDLHAARRRTVFRPSLAVVALVLVALSGCLQSGESSGSPGAAMPMSIFITDAEAELTRLDVGVASVTVGDPPVHLNVAVASFDLASLQGPDDALLLASGLVPVDHPWPVEVTFEWARATVGNETFDVAIDGPIRLDGQGGGNDALLIDVGLPESLHEDADGLHFLPTVKEVYVPDGAPSAEDPISWIPTSSAQDNGVPALPDGDEDGSSLGTATPEAEAELPAAPAGTADAGAAVGWLVTFEPATKDEMMRQKSSSSGAVFVFALQTLPIAYVMATDAQAQRLSLKDGVLDMEREQALEFHDAESRQALRMPALTDPVTGLRDAAGNPIDGRGVGVAVVDTGIYAAHADLLYQPLWSSGPVASNLKVESKTFTEMVNTDTTAGHGTHVAGIIAGQGSSDPDRRGIAPGATLYGLGVGEVSTTVWAAQAFDWILDNHEETDPPIKVVTNSWSTGTSYDPGSVTNRLAGNMADAGLVVVFSAGNRGGDGSTNEISAQCRIPKAGILCVAAYDDMGTGTRSGEIADYSSRGLATDASTWPDISAPGTSILSARPPVGTTTGVGTNLGYVELSGTSQAAPHVAGVAALMLQMDPSLNGADVEAAIKANAHKFAHGGAYTAGSHHAKGAGLVDAYAAVSAVS